MYCHAFSYIPRYFQKSIFSSSPGTEASPPPSSFFGVVKTVALLGGYQSCAIHAADESDESTNILFCWGTRGLSVSGDTVISETVISSDHSPTSVALESNQYEVDVAVGYWNHTHLIDNEGELLCWGGNANGELGTDGTPSYRSESTPTSSPHDIWTNCADCSRRLTYMCSS